VRAKGFCGRSKIRLGTLGNVRSEMAVAYRSAVRGELTWQDAAKAVYVLNVIAQLDQGLVVAGRIAEIEARLGTIKANGSARPEARA
jgi:hypothetical protein